MKKISIITLALMVAAFALSSCNKSDGGKQPTKVMKITKIGSRVITYDAQLRVSSITEYEGEYYSKTVYQYNGNTLNVLDEEKWKDWHQDPTLAFVFTLNDKGYATALTHKKEAGDIKYKFEYDANGFMVKAFVENNGKDQLIFTRETSGNNVARYIQSKRYFEFGPDWSRAEETNPIQKFVAGSNQNLGGIALVEYPDFRRDSDNGEWKLEKMFTYAGLYGRASDVLPASSSWVKSDGSPLPSDYYDTSFTYKYTFDKNGYVTSIATNEDSPVEIQWEEFEIK